MCMIHIKISFILIRPGLIETQYELMFLLSVFPETLCYKASYNPPVITGDSS